ncbi:Rv0361 family membrane protein [Mycolicibacterium phlei]
MSNPSGPDQPEDTSGVPDDSDAPEESGPDHEPRDHEPATEVIEPSADHEPATEIISAQPHQEQTGDGEQGERRFTAPSTFDATTTQKIDTPADPATEVFTPVGGPAKPVAPQEIPPRGDAPKPPAPAQVTRSWGWVVAVVLVIAALVAIAVLGTVLLTRDSKPKVSQEDLVRQAIQEFDAAIQSGDLAKLRSITCGSTRDSYVNYNEKSWADTHRRVAAAKQYPVVASIDQVIINGDHAEANVTAFMAYAPQTRSTRSFDLEFRDDQWKICQAPAA